MAYEGQRANGFRAATPKEAIYRIDAQSGSLRSAEELQPNGLCFSQTKSLRGARHVARSLAKKYLGL